MILQDELHSLLDGNAHQHVPRNVYTQVGIFTHDAQGLCRLHTGQKIMWNFDHVFVQIAVEYSMQNEFRDLVWVQPRNNWLMGRIFLSTTVCALLFPSKCATLAPSGISTSLTCVIPSIYWR